MELWLESVFSLSPTKFLIIKVGFVLLSHLKCLLYLHCIIQSKTHLIYYYSVYRDCMAFQSLL